MPNLYPFCKNYNPTEIPPPPHEQINDRGMILWKPARCHFAFAREPETRIDETVRNNTYERIQTEDIRVWTTTGRADLRREIFCMEHTRIHPMLYLRPYTAIDHYQQILQNNYHLEISPIAEHPEVVIAATWIDTLQWWVLNRPPADNLHTHWIRNNAFVAV